MIRLDDITLTVAGKELISHASCQISDGQRVGIVGDNGCGKSTLFRALLGQLDPLTGKIELPKNAVIAFVEQEISDTSIPILQFVLQKDVQLSVWRQKLKTASDDELAEIHEHLNLLQSDSAEGRVAAILDGLGFKQSDFNRPVHDFSGGWRMRLTLAGALFQQSDILLLDEPTNHLDLEATVWLESYLKKYTGTLLLISHDKNFLDNNCSAILHFEQKKLVLYSGNYETFRQTFAVKSENLKKQIEKDAAKRAHLQSFIDRFRYKATKAKQAQSRLKMLEKMGEQVQLIPDQRDVFTFPAVEHLASPYVRVENVSVGYEDVPVLSRLCFSLGENERIALLGRNGNGKSTLAKLLAGELMPMGGDIFKSAKLRVGFFNQHQNEMLPVEETPVSFMSAFLPDKREAQVRSYLAQFGLEGDKAVTRIGLLSGGEKARLVLAKICLDKPHLMILDEPTNHLDMKGREALIAALNQYAGSVILITHDFHILECVCDTLWIVEKGSCHPFDGDLADYKRLLLASDADASKLKPDEKGGKAKALAVKEKKLSKSTISARIRAVEQVLDQLNTTRGIVLDQLASGQAGLDWAALNRKLVQIDQEIGEQEAQWDFFANQL